MDDDRINILIVDDESAIRDLLCEWLTGRNFSCIAVGDGISALDKLLKQAFEVVLLDIKLPGMSGMDVLREVREKQPSAVTIMMTAINEVETAVKAMKMGAVDYVVKPFNLGKLGMSISFALATALEISLGAESLSEMDAIALGVEQRRESVDGHSQFVTQSTIEIARQMGVSEKMIRSWAIKRLRAHLDGKKKIRIAMEKLQQSPLAQALFGLSEPCSCPRMPDHLRN